MIETTKYTTLNVVKAVTLQIFFPRLTVFKKKGPSILHKGNVWVDGGQVSQIVPR
jgi:hypothetical protein